MGKFDKSINFAKCTVNYVWIFTVLKNIKEENKSQHKWIKAWIGKDFIKIYKFMCEKHVQEF